MYNVSGNALRREPSMFVNDDGTTVATISLLLLSCQVTKLSNGPSGRPLAFSNVLGLLLSVRFAVNSLPTQPMNQD